MGKTEEWMDILGFEGVYQVSNKGRVRRLTFSNNVITKSKIHVIKATDNGKGYLFVTLHFKGKRHNQYIHRLVADAFCSKRDTDTVVNHKDYNKYNNVAENLEWCTQKENVRYSSGNMKREKSVCKLSNTGEKYISFHVSHGKYERYRVQLKTKRVSKEFKTLEEAIQFRNEVVCGGV